MRASTTFVFRLLCFFGLLFGVVRNRRLNRFVRFNAMQALLIDILLMCDNRYVRDAIGHVLWM